MFCTGSAVKEVLRQTAEFESKAADILNKELDQTDPASIRELEEVKSKTGLIYSLIISLTS